MAIDAKIIANIRSNKLFDFVDQDKLNVSVSGKDLVAYRDGDIIYQTGDPAEQIYLILDGLVKIKHTVAIDGQRIFEKGQGEFFGEREFMDREPRASSAVAIKDTKLFLIRRKELNDLFAKHKTILNNVQGLEPGRDEAPELKGTRETYPDEITSLLKTSESQLDPYAYKPPNQSVDINPVNKGKDMPLPEEAPVKKQPTIEDEFPHRFKTTFEDSFTFGDLDKIHDPLSEKQPAPEPPIQPEETVNHDEIDGFKGFSWDFSAEPPAEDTVPKIDNEIKEPEVQPEGVSFDAIEDEIVNKLGFKFPSDTSELPVEPDQQEEPLDWTFDQKVESVDEPPVNGEPDELQEEEKFTWDFSVPEEDDEPVVKSTETVHESENAPRQISEPEKQVSTVPGFWDSDDTFDEPIHGGSFDEFGNLIPEPPPEDLPQKVSDDFSDLTMRDVMKEPVISEEEDLDERAATLESPLFGSDLQGENLNIDPPADDAQFGKEGFQFTAPLEVRAAPAPPPQVPLDSGLSKEQLHLIIEAAQIVNSHIKLDEVLNHIVQAASSITQADRGTLYIVDHSNEEIWSKVIRGDEIEEIRLHFGQGLAGWVAQTGETVNIKNVVTDPRFDSNIDKVTGYKTKNMLCYPIKNKAGLIIAVIQLLNSKRGEFSQLDECFLETLSVHIAIALENAELVEQLLKTDRLGSLGKVAKFLISDIKKPILTIKQLAEHIKKKNVSAEVNQVLSLIIEQSNIVVDLVLTTLSYSEGKTVLNKKVLGLHRVLDELLDLLAEYVEYRKIKLFKKYGPDVLINVDRREMYQAFFQITKNACDAMMQGGELYVTARLADAGDTVQIAFKDKGNGIPTGVMEKIFEPFMSHGKPHGVGLGLPITDKIVKEHEGKVSIESKPGEGTTVTISLPVVKEF